MYSIEYLVELEILMSPTFQISWIFSVCWFISLDSACLEDIYNLQTDFDICESFDNLFTNFDCYLKCENVGWKWK